MNAGTLLIRADANERIGTGHVMRCLALAQAWQDTGGRVHWACQALPSALENRLQAEGMTFAQISEGAAALEGVVSALAPAWLTLDGKFDVSHQRVARDRGVKALVVDDDASLGEYEVDLVLDHNVFADEARYPMLDPRRLLAGPRYALLRRELVSHPIARARLGSRVLVSFGGADPARLAGTSLEALARLVPDVPALEATLLLGPATPHKNEVIERARSLSFVRVVCDAVDMRPHLLWADIAVVAAGGTCLELAYAGVPMLAVVTADNQHRVAETITARNVARSLGEASALDASTLTLAIGSLLADTGARSSMSSKGPTLVDGLGARRVVRAMETAA
jgi:UDP-2,4-diacetamido-2,4,6-trideoxy-beta-L-altropyranose hydrolase